MGAGVQWSEVTAALAPHGLVGRAGSSGSVGVAGYSLGGGYSWLGRRHGLAVSSVTAVELVTGDGVFHRVDADTEPELFWAVRGGGANVGVVCALEFTAIAADPRCTAARCCSRSSGPPEVFAAYEHWTRDLDDVGHDLRAPAAPAADAGAARRCCAASPSPPSTEPSMRRPRRRERLLAPLRALGPAMDTFGRHAGRRSRADPHGPARAHAGPRRRDDPGRSAGRRHPGAHGSVGPGVETPLLAVDLRHLGGRVGEPDPNGGAVNHFPGRFLLYAVGITPTPDAIGAVEGHVAALREALTPWAAEHDYLNFRDSDASAERFWSQGTIDRLLGRRASQARSRRHPARTITARGG